MAPLIGAVEVILKVTDLETLGTSNANDVSKLKTTSESRLDGQIIDVNGEKCSVSTFNLIDVCGDYGDSGGSVETVGSASLSVATPIRGYTDGKDIAQSMCSHISTALKQCSYVLNLEIEKHNLSKGLSNTLNASKKIKDLSKALSGNLETSALFANVVGHSRDILHAERATLFLVDPATN